MTGQVRVHITYDVQTGGNVEKQELPLVVGILADLSGNAAAAQPTALAERGFTSIDHGTFDQVLAAINPRLSFTVENPGGARQVNLSFKSLNDFNPRHIADQIEDLIGLDELDQYLRAQLNLILHAPELQKLEASWRGLHQLLINTRTATAVTFRLLDVTQEALRLELEAAVTFDQSALFKLLLQAGNAGDEPFGVVMADFEFGRSPADISMLGQLFAIAEAVHAPFIAAANAQLIGLQSFEDLNKVNNLALTLQSDAMADWRALQSAEGSRSLYLTLPRYLCRRPYDPINNPAAGLPSFHECSAGLWGNAAWLLTRRIVDAFAQHRWWPETLVTDGFPVATCPTEVAITAANAHSLGALGFIALTHRPDSDEAVFAGGQSLPCLLDASRFALYMTVIMRSKIGSFMTHSNVESYLNNWISQYVLIDDNASPSIEATYPLRHALVSVTDVPTAPGSYSATVWLRPHFQLQGLTASIRLVISLPT